MKILGRKMKTTRIIKVTTETPVVLMNRVTVVVVEVEVEVVEVEVVEVEVVEAEAAVAVDRRDLRILQILKTLNSVPTTTWA